MSYVTTFDIWQSLYYELQNNFFSQEGGGMLIVLASYSESTGGHVGQRHFYFVSFRNVEIGLTKGITEARKVWFVKKYVLSIIKFILLSAFFKVLC